MFCLSKKVRENNIKVVITGEGADEMLAGYDIFKEGIIREFWSRQPIQNTDLCFYKSYILILLSPGQEQEHAQIVFWISATGYFLTILFTCFKMEEHISIQNYFSEDLKSV